MATTEPIKNMENLEKLKDFYITKKPNIRNSTLIIMGLNSILRISDLLNLKWIDVYDFGQDKFRTHIEVLEKKTKKTMKIILNQSATEALKKLKESCADIQPNMYLFYGEQGGYFHLSRSQAYRIIHDAAETEQIGEHISCHSLRKTFGFQAWKQGVPPAMLTALYNHSSYEVTKRYLGIDQTEKDNVFLDLNL